MKMLKPTSIIKPFCNTSAKGKWCTTTISTCCPRKPPIFCQPSVLFPVSGMLQNRCFLSLVCLASSLNSSYPRPMPRPFYTICNTQIQLFFSPMNHPPCLLSFLPNLQHCHSHSNLSKGIESYQPCGRGMLGMLF